jgi:uncharacterized membrane protein
MRIAWRVGVLALVVAAIAGGLVLFGLGRGQLATTQADAAVAGADCSWFGETASNDVNTGAPDLDANYLYAPLDDLPAGSSIEITGAYPHVRYFSFTLYGTDQNALTSIYDQQIQPDPGSYNPFLTAGHPGEGRNYTVHVLFVNQPADPAPNTVYAGPPTSAAGTVGFMVLRLYLPVGSPSGGVDYPKVTVLNAAGSPVSLSEGACGDTFSIEGSYYDHYATENAPANQATPADGTTQAISWTRSFSNGFGNLQNSYLQTLVSHHWGQLVVTHFRAPTFPDTSAGASVFGDWDMRYWSICDYDSTGTEVYGCVPDDAVPRDGDGWVTVVVSEAGQRPANATAADGVAWVPWSPQNEIQLVQRNLLPSASFAHASESITTPAQNPDAAKIMGAYYPTSAYCSETTFEQGGWQACLPALATSLAKAGEDTVAVGCAGESLTFRQHPAAPVREVRAVVYVNGRRVRTLRGHAIAAVRVTRPTTAHFSVRVVATLSDGEIVARRVSYDGCSAAKPAVSVLHRAR